MSAASPPKRTRQVVGDDEDRYVASIGMGDETRLGATGVADRAQRYPRKRV
jgi:hypothetical protein